MKSYRYLPVVLAALAAPASAQDPSPIVQGVNQVCPAGGAGAIQAFPGAGVIPIVSGDDDASMPNLFAAIGSLGTAGSGHVLAVGHDGFLGDTANSQLDTLRFNTQAIDWLDAAQTDQVAILAGHGEFKNAQNMTVVVQALTTAGFTVTHLPGVVTPSAIAGKGVLVVGNAWNAFQATELAAIQAHVAGGGGLYLAGLGWSYPSSRVFADYPMNVLGAPYGLGWSRRGISDPTNNLNGSAVFTRFYPDCDLHVPDRGIAYLDALMSAHPTDLNLFLLFTPQVRADCLFAATHINAGLGDLPEAGGARPALDAMLRGLMLQHPQWLGMAGSYVASLDGALAVMRASFGAAIVSAYDLDGARQPLVEAALGILDPAVDPDYLTILRDHGFVLLDNRTFTATHRAIILDLMTSIADVPRSLQRMTCKQAYSTDPTIADFPIPGIGVNVFGVNSINSPENQFPGDIAARTVPVFATTVCHELAHVIDHHLSLNEPAFATRKTALLAAAGSDDLQFLRSQIGATFFQNNPGEFFASLANEWNTDSTHTLRLALQRFASGKEQPLQQALFMADTYGRDGMTTPLYTMASTGRIATTTALLSRDVDGRITAICDGTTAFEFTYDAAGNVVTAVELAGACGSAWQDLGLGLAGSGSPPVAAGGGSFQPAAPIAVRVHHAPANAFAAVVIGLGRGDLSFFGGTLVPRAHFTVLVLTDASGSGAMSLPWPAGAPTGISTFYQAWMIDAAGPAGLAASNAIRGITP